MYNSAALGMVWSHLSLAFLSVLSGGQNYEKSRPGR